MDSRLAGLQNKKCENNPMHSSMSLNLHTFLPSPGGEGSAHMERSEMRDGVG